MSISILYLREQPPQKRRARSGSPKLNFSNRLSVFESATMAMSKWSDLFTPRQLLALSTLSDLVREAVNQAKIAAVGNGFLDDEVPLRNGGKGALAYGEAIAVYLGFLVDQQSNQLSTCCGWNNINQQMIVTFSMQALQMKWDFAECEFSFYVDWKLCKSVGTPSKGVCYLSSR